MISANRNARDASASVRTFYALTHLTLVLRHAASISGLLAPREPTAATAERPSFSRQRDTVEPD